MKKFGFIILFFSIFLLNCQGTKELVSQVKLTSFVNPFIGTDGPGNTYPGATVPFGMVQLSPDIGISGWDRISGYFYQDSIISGFSHMHLSGTGAGDLYDILVMPTNSRFSKRIETNNLKPFSSFSHEKETASPGYYSVDLLDYGIKAELTATERTGIHRYTFPKDETGNTVSFYIATGFDLKRYYYKKYDVYQGSSAGLGAGLRQELVGTEAVLAHVPHRVDYSVTSTVG